MAKIDYYHLWNVVNLSILIIGWSFIMQSFFIKFNELNSYLGFFMVIIISISIYYQNKFERGLE